MIQQISNIRKDFVLSRLRLHASRLHQVLYTLENDESADCLFTQETLKEIEHGLRKVRQLCAE